MDNSDSMQYPPFDPVECLYDDAHNPIRFLNTPLDEKYLEPPGDFCPAGMLPPQDLEVRNAGAAMKLATERFIKLGILDRFFNRAEYLARKDLAIRTQATLRTLVNSSPEHKAALRRIVHAAAK